MATRASNLLGAAALLCLLVGCATSKPPPHQKGGSAAQSLGPAPAMPRLNIPTAQPKLADPVFHVPVAGQAMQQPENPLGESKQVLHRTITTTAPTGEVVTTVERAETVIGGSQSLADIAKQIMGAEHWKNMAVALLMGIIAWIMRKEWPTVAGILALGAIVVAFFGLQWALGFAGIGGGIFIGYHLLKSQLPIRP
jgi:hypothetical protein